MKKLLCLQAGYFFFRPGIGESAFIFPPLVHVWYAWWHSKSSALSSLWYFCFGLSVFDFPGLGSVQGRLRRLLRGGVISNCWSLRHRLRHLAACLPLGILFVVPVWRDLFFLRQIFGGISGTSLDVVFSRNMYYSCNKSFQLKLSPLCQK